MTAGRLQLGRAFGIPIYLHFSWFVVFALFTWTLAVGYFPQAQPHLAAATYWAKALITALFFFASIVLHELAHAAVAVRHGVRIRSVTLFIFGGVAQMEGDAPDGGVELKIAIVGPIVSLALAALFYLLAISSAVPAAAREVAEYLSFGNLALAIFNLVPACPLDGGRVLRGLLWRSTGKLRATRIAAGAGTLFAYVLIASGALGLLAGSGVGGVWQILIGWFLKDASAGAYGGARLDELLRDLRVRDAMSTEAATVPAHISVAEAARDYFMRTGYGGYPVVTNGQLVGLLCFRDIQKLSAEEREGTSVQGAMRRLTGGITIEPDAPLRNAMAQMAQTGLGRLLVVSGDRLVGLLTMNAILRHVRVREGLLA